MKVIWMQVTAKEKENIGSRIIATLSPRLWQTWKSGASDTEIIIFFIAYLQFY